MLISPTVSHPYKDFCYIYICTYIYIYIMYKISRWWFTSWVVEQPLRFASLRMLRLYELADLLEKVVPWVHPKSSDGETGSASWAKTPWTEKCRWTTGETYQWNYNPKAWTVLSFDRQKPGSEQVDYHRKRVLLVRYPCSSIFQWIIVQKKNISFKRQGSRKIGFLKSC